MRRPLTSILLALAILAAALLGPGAVAPACQPDVCARVPAEIRLDSARGIATSARITEAIEEAVREVERRVP